MKKIFLTTLLIIPFALLLSGCAQVESSLVGAANTTSDQAIDSSVQGINDGMNQ